MKYDSYADAEAAECIIQDKLRVLSLADPHQVLTAMHNIARNDPSLPTLTVLAYVVILLEERGLNEKS